MLGSPFPKFSRFWDWSLLEKYTQNINKVQVHLWAQNNGSVYFDVFTLRCREEAAERQKKLCLTSTLSAAAAAERAKNPKGRN